MDRKPEDNRQSLSLIRDDLLEAASRQITIGSDQDVVRELENADEIIAGIALAPKDALHAKLIFEETLGMLKEMIENYQAVVRLEKYKEAYCLKLTATTDMDYDKKEGLLSLASDHKNDSVRGFMDKIGDIIQTGLLNYENTMKLSQKYGGGYVNYGMVGMYGSLEGIDSDMMMWSLYDYRNGLDEVMEDDSASKEAWDELEKSIVANIAEDVIVGIKGDRVDMSIICKKSKQNS